MFERNSDALVRIQDTTLDFDRGTLEYVAPVLGDSETYQERQMSIASKSICSEILPFEQRILTAQL